MIQLARRYAKALLSIAIEERAVEKFERELAEFAKLVEEHAELKETLADPTVLPSSKRDILKGIVDKLGLSENVRNFIVLLGEKGRVQVFSEIQKEFRRMADEHAGRARATVTSAAPLTPDVEKALSEKLSKLTGRTVELSSKIDPELLGGIVAEIGGVVYDGSLRTQLRHLRDAAKG